VTPAWAVFAAICTVLMWAFPGYETIPYHFAWISLALVYGVRPWPLDATVASCVAIAVLTGAPLAARAYSGVIPFEETAEIPLMTSLFLVMVWHARRRNAAVAQARLAADREREAHQIQDRFVMLASHELRTPITVARGYAELLRQETTDPQAAQDVDVVLDEIGKLERIASRLLAVARAQEPGRWASGAVDIGVLVCRVVRRWNPAGDGAIRAEVQPSSVKGDADRLETALDCLVENALVHAGDDPRIIVRAYPARQGVVIEVEDDGPGVTPEHLAAVLRGQPSGPPGRRQGLGFMIVTSVAAEHAGEVTFGSGAAGGLLVRMWLPANPGPSPLPGPAPDREPASGPAI
jgi:signal transduction histidine kinase